MVNLAQAWAEAYAAVRPEVSVEVAGGGSGTGIASLIDGTADLANSSRRIEPEEREAALRKTGREPREWIAGLDALAVYVHLSNPLRQISIRELARIYGRQEPPLTWRDLGVTIPGARTSEMVLISRQSNSGTYHYFRRSLLGDRGDFRLGTRDLNGSKEVVSLIGGTPSALGYSGMGYATPAVHTLSISRSDGEPAVAPTPEAARTRQYPLTRPLYLYTLGEPSGPLETYLDWIASPPGQRIILESGYVPIDPAGAAR